MSMTMKAHLAREKRWPRRAVFTSLGGAFGLAGLSLNIFSPGAAKQSSHKKKRKKCKKRCKKDANSCHQSCDLLPSGDRNTCKQECDIAKKACTKTC